MSAIAFVSMLLLSCGQEAIPSPLPPVTLLGQTIPEELVRQGAQIYTDQCLLCHGDEEGRGGQRGVSPHNGDGHTWHHPDHQLTAWTVNGRIGDMPAFGERLENREVIAVLAFIKTWWTEEQRLSQADLTLRYQDALEKAR